MKDISNIEKYLCQEMTDAEKRLFEAELAKDTTLQAEYLFHLALFEALKKQQSQENTHKMAAKDWVTSLENQAEKPQKTTFMPLWTKYAAAASLVFLLCGGIYYFLQNSEKKETTWVKRGKEMRKDTAIAVVTEDTNKGKTDKVEKKDSISAPSQKMVALPREIKNAEKIDNSKELAILQQIIDIKKETSRYQDSIEVIANKKVVGFSGTKTEKTQWKVENEFFFNYKKNQKIPSSTEVQLWQKQRIACWEELAATKEMWNKYKNK